MHYSMENGKQTEGISSFSIGDEQQGFMPGHHLIITIMQESRGGRTDEVRPIS